MRRYRTETNSQSISLTCAYTPNNKKTIPYQTLSMTPRNKIPTL